jgi:DNA-damage-inducible protein D
VQTFALKILNRNQGVGCMESHAPQLTYVRDALEKKKYTAPNGQPFWVAREIMEILDYRVWQNFRAVIETAKKACETAGNFPVDHFVDFDEMVSIGSGATRKRDNCKLSKYACFLVAMNGDPSKPQIATAQAYFAVQTHRQETEQALTDLERRLLVRDRVKNANRRLSGAAKAAGVRSAMFGVFHDAGFRTLYGGYGQAEIKKQRNIPQNEELLDCMGRTELTYNEFRAVLTEDKLAKDRVRDERRAIETHRNVGSAVRETIKNVGGTMPEKLPPEPSLKRLAPRKRKKITPSDQEPDLLTGIEE